MRSPRARLHLRGRRGGILNLSDVRVDRIGAGLALDGIAKRMHLELQHLFETLVACARM